MLVCYVYVEEFVYHAHAQACHCYSCNLTCAVDGMYVAIYRVHATSFVACPDKAA